MIPVVNMDFEKQDDDNEQIFFDLENLSDDDFQERYKATKRQFKAIVAALKTLHEVGESLAEEGGPADINYEIIDATRYLIDDYEQLLEQMSMAAYWQKEGI